MAETFANQAFDLIVDLDGVYVVDLDGAYIISGAIQDTLQRADFTVGQPLTVVTLDNPDGETPIRNPYTVDVEPTMVRKLYS
jgi:hypothetical protein